MQKPINFFSEEIEFKISNEEKILKWLLGIIIDSEYELEEINYIFCSDEYLHKINLEQLNHDTYTDVITFQYNDSEEAIESDIYISIDRIRENAEKFKVTFEEELHRVMVHGILHMIGYNDKSEKEEEEMREKENASLSLLK